MANQEFEEILASLQQIVRQAYALGRSDALKQVVDVLKNDGTAARPLALTGPAEMPAETAPPRAPEVEPVPVASFKASNDDAGAPAAAPTAEAGPWWRREPRRMW